ncbi:MAG: Zn-dependent hydrolase, partial [Chloroflexota bacterium]
GSIAALLDVGKKVLFGQDIHGPYYPQWGSDPDRALASLRKLSSLQADILCEGHFGTYEPATAVKDYIESYVRELERGA